MDELIKKIRIFAHERDWKQYHSPKNLSMALVVEASEIIEIFQWLTEKETRNLDPIMLKKVKEEVEKEVSEEVEKQAGDVSEQAEEEVEEQIESIEIQISEPTPPIEEEQPAEESAPAEVETPASVLGDLIQDAAAGLLNGMWNFIKWTIGSGIKATSSIPFIQKIEAGLINSSTAIQLWFSSLELKSLSAGLLVPITNLFGITK